MSVVQPDMIGHVKQPAKVRAKTDRIYDAICALRGRGIVVHRRGRKQHAVQGRLLTHEELVRLARGDA